MNDEYPCHKVHMTSKGGHVTVLLGAMASGASMRLPAALHVQGTIIGLFRDLRGIATATNSRRTYGALFDWLYPTHMPVIIKCLEVSMDVCVYVCICVWPRCCRTCTHLHTRLAVRRQVPVVTRRTRYSSSADTPLPIEKHDSVPCMSALHPGMSALQAWADVPDVTTPLLKFMAEFVFNKSTRLTFDASSPNGILLFRWERMHTV